MSKNDKQTSEKLGENNSLLGKGAVLADVTVYGPGGANDIEYYQGYTMTSDPTRWGVIADGEYIVNYDEIGKSGNLKSHWAINGRGKVPAKDGINPSPYRSYENALIGTFIHSTNENGFMGNYWNSKRQDFGGISEGCLIIAPSVYNHDGKLLKKGWDQGRMLNLPTKEFKRSGGYDKIDITNGYTMYIGIDQSNLRMKIVFPTIESCNAFTNTYYKLFNIKF